MVGSHRRADASSPLSAVSAAVQLRRVPVPAEMITLAGTGTGLPVAGAEKTAIGHSVLVGSSDVKTSVLGDGPFYYWRQLGRGPKALKLPNGDIRIRRRALDSWLCDARPVRALGRQEWTDNGEARERRALKRRASNTVRTVPIPAELVSLLRTHLETFGTGDAGAVFRNERGGPFNEASARRAWARARLCALTEEQVHSPLARRPATCTTRRPRCGSTTASPPPRSPGGSATTSPCCSRSTPTASTDRKDRSMTGSPPLSRPTTTMRHCPRRHAWTLRPSQTRGPDADQSQHHRPWTRQDRRSALVAQGIEHRFPKVLAVPCRRSPITPQQPA